MKKKINWGIIGCGNVTEYKSGPAFNKVEGSNLVAVMRRDAELAKDYAHRHNVPKWYSNADDLINDKDVNAIYIATPPSSHAMYAIKAMKAGKPVYVEKPMAATYEQCREMNAVSKETGVPLFVAYYRRTLPGFRKVKTLVEDGTIGRPLLVNIMLVRPASPAESDKDSPIWRVQPDVAGGGIFYDLASHQLDFLDFLFGPVKNVSGLARNFGHLYKAEDTVVAQMEFENGVLGSGTWSFVSDHSSKRDVIEIIGTKGRIEFSTFGHEPVLLFKERDFLEFPYINPENIQYNLIQNVVDAIRGDTECVSTGITAARTNLVMEKIVY
ncbi:Gfo/Idh/MocA family protein [Marinilabilia salmonicolor]|jgi:predicted dehydrogenase|uniref:Putative dehydrogenase n=1 Tax=Marinilabilia salmonicolor TaxID=989 RepID=A0A2T0XQ94_9BACT|nr:Gfo/Idh/MocA family oxidoreductase [Marinilabilia salmonicolor]PRZ01042.1 putative dehydrogenase [Marinilabilia salmonicolor]RCW33953.1 putative dehydrogenase [Marinilabilia salmonicolor]